MTHLTTNERYQIEHDLRLGLSTAQIAQAMGRSIRTIQRELSNNGGRHTYDARQAIDKRRERARISSKNHPSNEDAVWEKVLNRVKCKLSPYQDFVVESLSISISAVYLHLHRTKKI
ncbi:MAG: helix-turn-helix domain-containing protein, partial [Undibacterium sp.]|nr:helix-turn-helix domain-containing protein [Undibacterium sp.]